MVLGPTPAGAPPAQDGSWNIGGVLGDGYERISGAAGGLTQTLASVRVGSPTAAAAAAPREDAWRAGALLEGIRERAQTGQQVAGGLLSGIRERVTTGHGAIGEHLDRRRKEAAELAWVGQLQDLWQERRAHMDFAALQGAGFGLIDFGANWQAAKKDAQRRLLDMGAPVRAKVMFGLLCVAKTAATSDPDMCECIRYRINDLVDVLGNDLTLFVEQMVDDQRNIMDGKVATTMDELGEFGDAPMFFTPAWFRAFLLHHMMPFDRSLFGQVKDPVWWVFTIISLIPVYGIRIGFFLTLLICIVTGRPADEYQLTAYIIGFKGSQFISSGVIQACQAAVRYYLCVHPGGTHTCDTDGPGANQDLVSGTIDFLGSCVLTWVAFFWLPCSARSAGMRVAVEKAEDEETGGCCGSASQSRGGRLQGLLGWDITTFILSVAFMFGLMYFDTSHLRPGGMPATSPDIADVLGDFNMWEGHTAIFWARVFYSMLSFPFIVFLIPGLNSVLTHTTATGYNRNGICVPFMMHPMPDARD